MGIAIARVHTSVALCSLANYLRLLFRMENASLNSIPDLDYYLELLIRLRLCNDLWSQHGLENVFVRLGGQYIRRWHL